MKVATVVALLGDLVTYRERIDSHKDVLLPKVRWTGEHEEVAYVEGP